MSSAADSIKQPATNDQPESDEPSSKKVKLATATAVPATDGDTTNNDVATINNNNNNNHAKSTQNNNNDTDDLQSTIDPKIAISLEQVEHIQSEICNLNEKASEEILKVEQKFNQLRRPHFEKRNELLKEIPNFWLTSLANHPTIAPMIESAEDEDCLHYMTNLDVEEFEDIKSGYRLKFHFAENPYISNEVISKEFQLEASEEVISTPIEFKNTPQGEELKRIVQGSLAQSRRRRPGQQHQSFFAWLLEGGQDEIAEILKDQIFPNPLELFFATPEDDYEIGSDESEDEDEEIDDEDADDDDDDDEVVIEEGGEIDDEDDDDDDDDEDVDAEGDEEADEE